MFQTFCAVSPAARLRGQLVILLAACTLFSGMAAAVEVAKVKEFLINSWDQGDGLPSTRVNDIARTFDGYVWLATYGGLVRFDGVKFTTFTTNQIPALRTNIVTRLHVDGRGVLWVGTSDGTIVKCDEHGFTEVNLPSADRYAGRWINAIAEDAQGALWLAIDGAGLVRIKVGEVVGLSPTNDLPVTNVTQLLRDRVGTLWAVGDGRLLVNDGQRWNMSGGPDAPEERIRGICESKDGGLWVATLGPIFRGARILKFKDGKWERELNPYPWPQGSVRSRTQALIEDKEGKLWCATAGGGVFFRTAEGAWQRLVSSGTLSQSDALCFMEDESGVVWIGTRTAGLHEVRPRPVRILQLPPEASQNVVLTVCAARDGSVWAGTEGAGIFRWIENGLQHYGIENGLTNLHINALLEDSRTNLWAGTVGGLFQFKDNRFEPVEGSPALQTSVMSLFEDHQGDLWAGSKGGLIRIHGGEVRVFNSKDGLGGAPVRALAEDQEGRLWVEIETAGLFRQNGERFEELTGVPSTVSTGARALVYDDNGEIWFATRSSGLFRWKNGQFVGWNNQNDGLPSDRNFGMVEDARGNLWLSTENGIFGCSKLALDTYERGQSPTLGAWRLTQADGLAYKVCTGGGQPAASRSADGLVWFGNGPTVAFFDPASVPRRVRVRPPIIEEVLLDNVVVTLTDTREIRVESGTSGFEFRYTSPNILSPQRLRFRYQLAGIDRHWIEADTRRAAYYPHLPPGHYKFNVQAASPDGDWRETMEPLSVVVVPRFYERRTVQAGGGILLLVAVAVIVWRAERNRSFRRLERLRWQSAMERERQRIARDIHDDLGSGLTEIILLSDNLRDELPASQTAEKMVGEISDRARALTRAMDEVVWAINPRNDTLESLLTYLNKYAQEYLARAGVRYRMDVPVESPPLPLSTEIRHHLYLASKEALNNVVKHSKATEVWIRLQTNNGAFNLSIEDNGHGFDSAKVGGGNGLQNMRKRLEELRGHCEIESKPGAGTRVTFCVLTERAVRN